MTFYLDADVPVSVRRAIAACRDDVLYAGGPGAPAVDALDEDWLPLAGASSWVVVTRNKRIRYQPGEIAAVMDHGVKLFVMTTAGNMTRWRTLELLVRRWRDIEATAVADGPFVCAVTLAGLRAVVPANLEIRSG